MHSQMTMLVVNSVTKTFRANIHFGSQFPRNLKTLVLSNWKASFIGKSQGHRYIKTLTPIRKILGCQNGLSQFGPLLLRLHRMRHKRPRKTSPITHAAVNIPGYERPRGTRILWCKVLTGAPEYFHPIEQTNWNREVMCQRYFSPRKTKLLRASANYTRQDGSGIQVALFFFPGKEMAVIEHAQYNLLRREWLILSRRFSF